MAVLRILLFSLTLIGSRSDSDTLLRLRIASAVAAVTDDEHEQNLLMKIARFESAYRADVVSCKRRGPQREITAWQILPRNDAERRALCVSIEGDAQIALSRIRESLNKCRNLKDESARLAVYTRGRCDSREGQRLSKTRWISRTVSP